MADEEPNFNQIKTLLDSEKAKILDDLFSDAEARKAYVKHMTKGKPRNWRKTSNATYYKEPYGQWFKEIIDAMMVDKQSREIAFEDFPNLSKNSVYLRVNQAKMYLLEEMDYDGSYKRFLECVDIQRKYSGIRLTYHKGGVDITPMPARVVAFNSITSVLETIERFLENPEVRETELRNLILSDDEMTTIHSSLASLTHIVYNLSPTTLKIVKIS